MSDDPTPTGAPRDESATPEGGGAAAIPPAPPGATTTPREDLLRGIWRENPVLIQLLGLCPALAVTNTVANSIAMSLATFFVMMGSSILVSSLKRVIPHQVRISAYILIIATFVTIADLVLAAVVPEIHKALGAFIALIVVNCMILGRQEAFASKRSVGRAILDAAGTGVGFTIALVLMGAFREVLGSGTFLGYPLFGPDYEPWLVMILPPGGFFTLGFLLLGLAWWKERGETKPAVRRWPHGVSTGVEREGRAA
ncbi:MAG: electron transport complex subunit RsxE [Gemmatimonadota bacterium]|nr:electron transport complex subunit RsxE [Gemmatimonadota bacterium]